MNSLKAVGLGAVLALALAGLLGPGTAAASPAKACAANEAPCSAANSYAAGTPIEATAIGVLLNATSCDSSIIKGEITGAGTAAITSITFSNCTQGWSGTPCQVTGVSLPSQSRFTQVGQAGDGALWVGVDGHREAPGVRVNCEITGENCVYRGSEVMDPDGEGVFSEARWLKLNIAGGSPASAKATNAVLKSEQCGGSLDLSASYSVVTPKPLYIAPPQAQLCGTLMLECPADRTYGAGSAIKAVLAAGTEAMLTGSLPVNCKTSTMEGKVTGAGDGKLDGELTSMTWDECKEQLFQTSCTVAPVATPYELNVAQTSFGNGTVWVGPNEVGEAPGMHISCPTLQASCTFVFKEVQNPGGEGTEAASGWAGLALTGGGPAKLSASAIPLTSTENVGSCGSNAAWNATYAVTQPDPLWIT